MHRIGTVKKSVCAQDIALVGRVNNKAQALAAKHQDTDVT